MANQWTCAIALAASAAAAVAHNGARGVVLERVNGMAAIRDKGAALAGGAPFDSLSGTFVSPNITPHSVSGTGRRAMLPQYTLPTPSSLHARAASRRHKHGGHRSFPDGYEQ